ncbi:hypothetical protein DPMN_017299 [Dreissena polymorpha]|uniref:Uncharacterized protein n=1 Tax=Dreissena polymorpha TaxID=45954 RepID=A0A9D4NEY2_DREPO|nr:hypothetical protein DPMN_017299 [Dreissena polymorpha]
MSDTLHTVVNHLSRFVKVPCGSNVDIREVSGTIVLPVKKKTLQQQYLLCQNDSSDMDVNDEDGFVFACLFAALIKSLRCEELNEAQKSGKRRIRRPRSL